MSDAFEEILERRKKGSLKIYLGYAAGVGKTYAMLQDAQRLKARGSDVAIGYLELHDRPETTREVSDLEIIPRRYFNTETHSVAEMDVAAIIKRKPHVVLIDDLAHTNAAGSKNEKRYLDVLELLEHGMNVITTMNVHHLDSVAAKLSLPDFEEAPNRVPDLILQRADQVVTVDVSIDELRERLRTGKIYSKERAEIALSQFFTHSNLSMLRETVLKEAACDQSRKIDEQGLLSQKAAKLSHETVMVCLSSNPNNAEMLIRRGAKVAIQLSSRCCVVYVQKKAERAGAIDESLQEKIQRNLNLAKSLGVEVFTLQGEDISNILVNFATENNVRHAVFGKSRMSPLKERVRGSVISSFTYDAVGVDVHILSTVEGEC